jgi:hypothetical protein
VEHRGSRAIGAKTHGFMGERNQYFTQEIRYLRNIIKTFLRFEALAHLLLPWMEAHDGIHLSRGVAPCHTGNCLSSGCEPFLRI